MEEDVLRLTIEEENAVINPNYFEAMITAEDKKQRITRKKLASWRTSFAIVLTVNRVQDSHPNDFDDCMATAKLPLCRESRFHFRNMTGNYLCA